MHFAFDTLLLQRRLPIGAELLPTGGVHFRVWASAARHMKVVLLDAIDQQPSATVNEPRYIEMSAEGNGYWSCLVTQAEANMRYYFLLDNQEKKLPDPASRFQPQGPHDASQIIDCTCFSWTDGQWKGIAVRHRIIYEMHIGTFTRDGTYRAAADELSELARLGITVIELMPLAEFSGEFGWGYDGVDFFAPYHHYGTPDDLRNFIDRAHALGIGVILDVVYNHCGSNGCYLAQFSPDYFTDRYHCEWGDAFNFDGPHSAPVREFIIANAIYWVSEFHMDGFRLDATQQMFDASDEHIIAALIREARRAAGERRLFIVGENEPQEVKVIQSSHEGGYDLDCVWNDDFHHAAMVALKGMREAYFTDYQGSPQEFVSIAKYGFLYQGQWYRWQKKRRGTPSFNVAPSAFVHFIQNHDQIANTGLGKRLHELTHPGLFRAFTAMLLLGPATPMLFQGQEFCASSPFLYFADQTGELADQVREGRKAFLHQFPSLAAPETQDYLSQPDDPHTFLRCQLNLSERELHKTAYALHQDLLQLRKDDPVFSHAQLQRVDGAVLTANAFILRFFASTDITDDRLLIINLGHDLTLSPLAEPLLAPPPDRAWYLLWSSEQPRYGGRGTGSIQTEDHWQLPAYSAQVFASQRFVSVDRGETHHER